MKILSDDAIVKAMGNDGWSADMCRAIAQAQLEEDRKWMIEWGNEPCKNEHHASGSYFYATHDYHTHKRGCYQCWQELEVKN